MSNYELAQLKQSLGLLEAERKHFAERFGPGGICPGIGFAAGSEGGRMG